MACPRHPQWEVLARALLAAGADPNDGQTLYNRTFRPDDSHLELLFAFGLDDAEELSFQLAWAAAHAFDGRVALLARHGVDLDRDVPGRYGVARRSPYALALVCGHAATAALLAELGASTALSDPDRVVAAVTNGGDVDPAHVAAAIAARSGLVPWLARWGRREAIVGESGSRSDRRPGPVARGSAGAARLLPSGPRATHTPGMPMPTLRRATPDDAPALAALAERTFRETFAADNTPEDLALHLAASYGPGLQRRELEDPQGTTLVAVDEGGALVAYAQLRAGGPTPPSVPSPDPIELRRFYVDRPWHGTGLAQRLLDAVFAEARSRGAGSVWLGVWEHNPRARAFYRKAGFAEVGTQPFVLGRDVQTDLVLHRPLPEGLRVRVEALASDVPAALEAMAPRPFDRPSPGPGEVVVAVRAAQVGWVDLIMASGQYQHVPDPPYTPGLEWSGTVAAVGEGVTRWREGDAVLGDGLRTGPRSSGAHRAWGGLATWTVAPQEALLPMPEGLSFAEAACLLGSYETAWHGLVHRGRVGPGDAVLVLGATGATGLAAVHLGVRAGATVIAAGRSAERLEAVRAEGAHHALGVPPAELPAAVKALTGGRGATVVWDGVGGEWSEAGVRAAAYGARFLVVGWASTPKAGRGDTPPNALPTNLILMKGLDVLGCPAVIATLVDPSLRPARLAGVMDAVAGGLRPKVHATWPLSRVQEALRAKWAGGAIGGLVVLPGA